MTVSRVWSSETTRAAVAGSIAPPEASRTAARTSGMTWAQSASTCLANGFEDTAGACLLDSFDRVVPDWPLLPQAARQQPAAIAKTPPSPLSNHTSRDAEVSRRSKLYIPCRIASSTSPP